MNRSKKPSRLVSFDERVRMVLGVLAGEVSMAGAAQRHGVSHQTMINWRAWFV